MLSKFNRLLPTVGKLVKQSRNAFATAGAGKDLSSRNTQTGVTKRDRLQFGKERLTDFGDLPAGEIPEALKYDLPVETSQLNNGVRVATMQWPGQLATITVHIKAGSRQETIENSGVSHFLQNLNLRGTKNRTRNQLEGELADIAGQVVAKTTRETTTYTITVAKNDVAKAVNILGDILTNSTYDKNQVEAERETVYREIIGLQKDQLESTVEASHYTSFRDHMLGQPVLGIRENIAAITQEQIVEYQKANYYGSNIVVTGAGDVSHQQLTELAEKALGGLAGSAPAGLEPKNSEQAYFTPSLMYMRDDEMANINIGIFFQAPSYTHEDYFSFLLYQRILGEYTESKNTGGHLNHSERQYNTLHSMLGSLPDITLQKTLYFPYSDTGLFGSYVHGNEVHAFQMLYVSQLVLSDYANYLNQVEVFRGKNKLYNDLLQSETGLEVTQNLGNQLLYLNRVVPRSEIAKRISSIEQPHLSRVARHWFFDTEISAVAWGPIHTLMTLAHYNRPIRRSTLGWYGDAAYHIH